MSNDDHDERFQMAAMAARRIVSQCQAHVRDATSKLVARIEKAPSTTPYGVEFNAAVAGIHTTAFSHRIKHAESSSNALLSHLQGLHVLLQHDTFHPLPAIPIARAIAEVSASTSWILQAGVTEDEKVARAYASLLRSIESTVPSSPDASSRIREKLVDELRAVGVKVVRRPDDKGRPTTEVAQVLVGRASAKTRFRYSQRIATEIPKIAGMYSGMSGITHGETMHVSSSWDTPDTYARVIGFVVHQSVAAWSQAVHTWIGVTPGTFLNQGDLDNLIQSMPSEYIAEFSQQQSQALES